MTTIIPTVREMSISEQTEYGLCGRGLMLEQGQYAYRLTAGTTDSVHVFQQGTILYVLTVNMRLSYVALDWYQGSEEDPVDSLFLQGDYVISECVCENWQRLSMLELARRLSSLFA